MRNFTKMFLCMAGFIILAGVYQFRIGNDGSLIIGGILMFSIGFGWYAKCAKIDDLKRRVGK